MGAAKALREEAQEVLWERQRATRRPPPLSAASVGRWSADPRYAYVGRLVTEAARARLEERWPMS